MAQALPSLPPPAPSLPFDTDALGILNKIRLLAARARCSARIDAFETCTLMQRERTAAASGYAEALLRLFRQGRGHAPALYPPGSKEISRDEAWLLRVITCTANGDESSLHFLTKRFLTPSTVRPMVFLARNIASRLDSF